MAKRRGATDTVLVIFINTATIFFVSLEDARTGAERSLGSTAAGNPIHSASADEVTAGKRAESAPSKLWVKFMRSTRLDGCMDAYLFEEMECLDHVHGPGNGSRHNHHSYQHRQFQNSHRLKGARTSMDSQKNRCCCQPRTLAYRQHAQDMVDVDRHFARLNRHRELEDEGHPPWTRPHRPATGPWAGSSNGRGNSSTPSHEDQVPVCDDLRRRRNWRHQTLFSGHGRDACGYFGIRGVLSQQTGFVRFIKTYFVSMPNQDQGPNGAAISMMEGGGGENGHGPGATPAAESAWSQGYDGRDPRKRTPGQWVFPEGEPIDGGDTDDDNKEVFDELNFNDTEDFWDVDTFGWCYRGFLDDGGDDGRQRAKNEDGDPEAASGSVCSAKVPKQPQWQSPKMVDGNDDGDYEDGVDKTSQIGGVGILGKWCDMHGGGPFWLFHRDLDELH
ncbi:hypothetical protein BGZ73_004557 [Actinomortierella ambigua]|nr:hypothetical protein BGZ73_004557 [Actinomortierella ambigua]